MKSFKAEIVSKFVNINSGVLAGVWRINSFVSPGYYLATRVWSIGNDPQQSKVLAVREFSGYPVGSTLEEVQGAV